MPNVKKVLMGAAGAGGGNEVYAWGRGNQGNLAQGGTDVNNSSSPVLIAGLSPSNFAFSGFNGFAIQDGNLYSWGNYSFGVLGDDGATVYPPGKRFAPPFATVAGTQGFAKLSEGNGGFWFHAVKTDGTLWAWGDNTKGQLGDGTNVTKSSPVQIGALTDWGSTCKIRGSLDATTALKADGSLWAWGRNRFGALGVNQPGSGGTYDISSPVQIKTGVADFTVLRYGGALVTTSGELFTWGRGTKGQLGNSTSGYVGIEKSSPIQVGALTDWSKLAATNSTLHSVKTDGTLWAWGGGTYGPNAGTNVSSPVQIGALTDWATPDSNTDAYIGWCVKTDGTLWGWGIQKYGLFQNAGIGTGDQTVNSPVQVGTQTHYGSPNKFKGAGGGRTVARVMYIE